MQTYKVTVDSDGTTKWCNELGQLHRVDGPAIEYASGTRMWYQNGQLHRTDGPASERAGGEQLWFKHGEYHRTDGPAVQHPDGYCEYWIDGIKLTQAEFEARNTRELTVAEVEALLGHRVKIKS